MSLESYKIYLQSSDFHNKFINLNKRLIRAGAKVTQCVSEEPKVTYYSEHKGGAFIRKNVAPRHYGERIKDDNEAQ